MVSIGLHLVPRLRIFGAVLLTRLVFSWHADEQRFLLCKQTRNEILADYVVCRVINLTMEQLKHTPHDIHSRRFERYCFLPQVNTPENEIPLTSDVLLEAVN
jgi:hypothetical protein